MQYVEILALVGEGGVYQWLVFVVGIFHSIWGSESISMNFLGYTPQHWCKVPSLANISHAQQRYISTPLDDVGEYESCRMYDLNYTQYTEEDYLRWDRNVMVSNTTPLVDCMDWEYDRSMFRSTLISRYNLVCGRSFMNQLLSTVFFAGIFVGAVGSGALSDRIGRRLTILISVIFKTATGFLAVFAPHYAALAVGRFCQGVGSTGIFLTQYVLLLELVGPSKRSLFGIAFQMAFSVGFMLCPGVAYAIRDDRLMMLATQVPHVLMIGFYWVMPESPRWLILKGRYAEAEKVICQMAAVNQKELPEKLDLRSVAEDGSNEIVQRPCGAMMKYPRMRTRTCIIDFHWFVCSLLYYAMALNTGRLAGDLFVNTVISGAVEVPANLICYFTLRSRVFGRRLTCALGLILAGLFSFLVIPMLLRGIDNGATAFSVVGKAFTTVGFSGIYVYSTEIFPTETRSSGMGTASMFARVSGMAAPYIGGPLGNVWKPLPSLIFGVFGTAAGLMILALPETLGYKMFETIEEAEAFNQKKANVSPLITTASVMKMKNMDGQIQQVDSQSQSIQEKV